MKDREAKKIPDREALPPAWEEKLRSGKVKVTPNRRRVLGRFLDADAPWTLKSLHRALNEGEACELSSVYRALSAFRTAGLLEEFRLPGKRETYYSLLRPSAGRRGQGKSSGHDHHHHHIVCQDCGTVSHLDVCVPTALLGRVEDASGFRVTEHHLEFKGLCGACR